MSFADLRSTRRNKDLKSFVTSSNVDVPENAEEKRPSEADSTEVKAGETKPSVVFGRTAGLPTTVEIRTSTVEGRGVHANVPFSPGDFHQRNLEYRLIRPCRGNYIVFAAQSGRAINSPADFLLFPLLQRCFGCRFETLHALQASLVLQFSKTYYTYALQSLN